MSATSTIMKLEIWNLKSEIWNLKLLLECMLRPQAREGRNKKGHTRKCIYNNIIIYNNIQNLLTKYNYKERKTM